MVRELFERAKWHDQELDIAHSCLTDLYNSLDTSKNDLKRIKDAMNEIKQQIKQNN